jgi:cysteine desulfurase family protein
MIYLDNAATSWPKPPSVSKAVFDFIEQRAANPGRSGHRMSAEAGRVVFEARDEIAGLFGLEKAEKIIFTQNATHALNIAILGLTSSKSRIVATSMEHNSVARVMRNLQEVGVSIDFANCDCQGVLDYDNLESLVSKGSDLVIINHGSNVTGAIQDLGICSEIAHKHGAILLVDAAQTAGCMEIDMKKMGIDLLAFTGHKALMGPQGTGGLAISDDFDHKKIRAIFVGGSGSKSESLEHPDFLPDKFECGTLNATGIAGLLEGIRHIKAKGLQSISVYEQTLRNAMMEKLLCLPKTTVYGPKKGTGVISFTIEGKDNAQIGFLLDRQHDIMCRTGLHCSPLAHKTIGTFPHGTIRFSVSIMNTMEEIDIACQSLRQIIEN